MLPDIQPKLTGVQLQATNALLSGGVSLSACFGCIADHLQPFPALLSLRSYAEGYSQPLSTSHFTFWLLFPICPQQALTPLHLLNSQTNLLKLWMRTSLCLSESLSINTQFFFQELQCRNGTESSGANALRPELSCSASCHCCLALCLLPIRCLPSYLAQFSFHTALDVREPCALARCSHHARKLKAAATGKLQKGLTDVNSYSISLWEHIPAPLSVLAFIKKLHNSFRTYHCHLLQLQAAVFCLPSFTARRNRNRRMLPHSFTQLPESRGIFFIFSIYITCCTMQGKFP